MTQRHPDPEAAGRPPAVVTRVALLRLLVFAVVLAPQAGVLLVQGFAPVLLREAPLVLLALHPFEPWALLVSPLVDPAPFVAILVSVRAVPYTAAYLLGRWYGERGLSALKRGGLWGPVARRVERLFARFGGLILLIYPGAVVSALAGATGLRPKRFVPLVLTGLALSAALIRAVAQIAAGPLLVATRFIDRSTTWMTVALLAMTVVLVIRQALARRRAGRAPAGPSAGADWPAGPATAASTSPSTGAGDDGR